MVNDKKTNSEATEKHLAARRANMDKARKALAEKQKALAESNSKQLELKSQPPETSRVISRPIENADDTGSSEGSDEETFRVTSTDLDRLQSMLTAGLRDEIKMEIQRSYKEQLKHKMKKIAKKHVAASTNVEAAAELPKISPPKPPASINDYRRKH